MAALRSAFVAVGVFSLAINLLMLTGPLFMLQLYDRVLTSRSVPTLVALAVLVCGLFLFLGLGAWLAIRQEITPGMIIATSIIAGRALAPVDQVIGQWRAILRARQCHRRLKEHLSGAEPGEAPMRSVLPQRPVELVGERLEQVAQHGAQPGRRSSRRPGRAGAPFRPAVSVCRHCNCRDGGRYRPSHAGRQRHRDGQSSAWRRPPRPRLWQVERASTCPPQAGEIFAVASVYST